MFEFAVDSRISAWDPTSEPHFEHNVSERAIQAGNENSTEVIDAPPALTQAQRVPHSTEAGTMGELVLLATWLRG